MESEPGDGRFLSVILPFNKNVQIEKGKGICYELKLLKCVKTCDLENVPRVFSRNVHSLATGWRVLSVR